MTKNIFIVAIAVLLSVAFCSLSAQNVSKDYNVGDFSAINLQSVGNIIFAQSAECTCRLGGPSEFVEKTRVTVKNGTLVIDYKEKNVKNVKNLIFYITAPDLSKVKIDGVGNFDAKEKLNQIRSMRNLSRRLKNEKREKDCDRCGSSGCCSGRNRLLFPG